MKRTYFIALIGSMFVADLPAATLTWVSGAPMSQPSEGGIVISNGNLIGRPAGDAGAMASPVLILDGLNFDIVVFSEKGGYGLSPAPNVEAFVWDSLNVDFNGSGVSVAPSVNKPLVEPPVGGFEIPGGEISLIGGMGMLLLKRRRY